MREAFAGNLPAEETFRWEKKGKGSLSKPRRKGERFASHRTGPPFGQRTARKKGVPGKRTCLRKEKENL